MEFFPKVGQKIRDERIKQGWVQTEFADEIGMSTYHYGEIERGRVNMSVEAVYRIAKGFDIPPYELLQVDDEGQKKYIITEEKKSIEGQEYTAYGIRYNDEYCISDVSDNKAVVEQLIRKYNKHHLDPIHLLDAIEDFLVE